MSCPEPHPPPPAPLSHHPAPPCRRAQCVLCWKQLLWPLPSAVTLLRVDHSTLCCPPVLAPPAPELSGQRETSSWVRGEGQGLGHLSPPFTFSRLIPKFVLSGQETTRYPCGHRHSGLSSSMPKMKGLDMIFSEVSSSPDTWEVHCSLSAPPPTPPPHQHSLPGSRCCSVQLESS